MRSSAASSHDPEAIRRLTRAYRRLRGLELLPLALVFLLMHAAELMGIPPWIRFQVTLFILVPAGLGTYLIYDYYNRRFGVVKTTWLPGVEKALLVVIAFIALQVTSAYFALPVQLGLFAAGIALAVYSLRHFELEGPRLLLAVFFVAISVWPRILDPREPGELWHNVFAIGYAGVWILMGILDHRTLVKAFERARLADTG